ncbi:hypothetical protein OB947_07355 [Aeromonas bestiarum]|uniref:hypothetical protein n=1 Tax=Aeromonas bestiarum TaxID=105751 RepID=UPI00259E20DB|nr:hypothetical protein [Aeromonas bestiarum]MDM5088737.1 hypothetical protein [Aeromonas bestiarum]
MPLFVALLLLVELAAAVGLILTGDLSGDMLMICYLIIATITAPVWFAILGMLMLWLSDWLYQRARARRIARCKAAKAAREAAAG